MRPENITVSGIKFVLSNHNIRKTLQTVYNLKFDRSRYHKEFTQNDKKFSGNKDGVDILNRNLPGVRTPEKQFGSATISH
jgi:hypothetical protein